jgi:hypothetical protein
MPIILSHLRAASIGQLEGPDVAKTYKILDFNFCIINIVPVPMLVNP